MLYQEEKGVSDAASPPEDDQTEAGDLSASSMLLKIDRPARMPQSAEKPLREAQRLLELILVYASHKTGLDTRSWPEGRL